MVKSHPTTIAIGKNKGHAVTKYKPQGKKANAPKQASTKGNIAKRTKFIRQIVNEVTGVSSYEKRIIEFLKAGSLKDTKKALKLSKKALGTHRRAKLKRENLMNLLRAQQTAKDKEKDIKKKWSLFKTSILIHIITTKTLIPPEGSSLVFSNSVLSGALLSKGKGHSIGPYWHSNVLWSTSGDEDATLCEALWTC